MPSDSQRRRQSAPASVSGSEIMDEKVWEAMSPTVPFRSHKPMTLQGGAARRPRWIRSEAKVNHLSLSAGACGAWPPRKKGPPLEATNPQGGKSGGCFFETDGAAASKLLVNPYLRAEETEGGASPEHNEVLTLALEGARDARLLQACNVDMKIPKLAFEGGGGTGDHYSHFASDFPLGGSQREHIVSGNLKATALWLRSTLGWCAFGMSACKTRWMGADGNPGGAGGVRSGTMSGGG